MTTGHGRAVVVVLDRDSKPNRLAYFKREAARVAQELGAAGPFELHTGRELVELARQFDRRSVSHLVICTHGGSEWVIHPGTGVAKVVQFRNRGQVDVAEVIAAWSPKMTHKVLLSLCACLCSRSPRWWLRRYLGRIWSQVASTWGKRSYQPGGQASIASSFRNMLVWWGHEPDVRAKKSAGDVLGNPLLSRHTGPAAGALSVPLCALALPGQPITLRFRRWWTRRPKKGEELACKVVRGRMAERWLLGDDSTIVAIENLWKEWTS